jgi:hypothetical protein
MATDEVFYEGDEIEVINNENMDNGVEIGATGEVIEELHQEEGWIRISVYNDLLDEFIIQYCTPEEIKLHSPIRYEDNVVL